MSKLKCNKKIYCFRQETIYKVYLRLKKRISKMFSAEPIL